MNLEKKLKKINIKLNEKREEIAEMQEIAYSKYNKISDRQRFLAQYTIKLKKVYKRYKALLKQKQAIQKQKMKIETRVKLREFKKFRSFGGDLVFDRSSDRESIDKIKLVAKYVPSAWLKNVDKLFVTVKDTDREHYLPRNNKIVLRRDSTRRTALHMLLHAVEASNKELLNAERDYYKRIKKETNAIIKPLQPPYPQQETGLNEGFLDRYTGKEYDGNAYEILSTGITGVFQLETHDYRFANDKKLMSFMYGILLSL